VNDSELRRRVAELEWQREVEKQTRDSLVIWSLTGLIAALLWKSRHTHAT
jgi:hypothetical protein